MFSPTDLTRIPFSSSCHLTFSTSAFLRMEVIEMPIEGYHFFGVLIFATLHAPCSSHGHQYKNDSHFRSCEVRCCWSPGGVVMWWRQVIYAATEFSNFLLNKFFFLQESKNSLAPETSHLATRGYCLNYCGVHGHGVENRSCLNL